MNIMDILSSKLNFPKKNLDTFAEESKPAKDNIIFIIRQLESLAENNDLEACLELGVLYSPYPSTKLMDYMDFQNYDNIFSSRAVSASRKFSDIQKAIHWLLKVTEIAPEDDRAYYLLHLMYRTLPFFDKEQDTEKTRELAIEYLEKAIQLNPNNAEYYIARGLLCRAYKNIEAYKKPEFIWENLDKAMELDDKNGDVFYARAIAYYMQNDKLNVIKSICNAINCNHDHVEYYNVLMNRALDELTGKKDEKSTSDTDSINIKNIIKDTLRDEAVLYCIDGWKCYGIRDYNSAIKYFEKALALEPKNASFQYRLGCSYLKYMKEKWLVYGMNFDMSETTIAELRKSLELNPNLRCLVMDKIERLDNLLGFIKEGNRSALVDFTV